VVYFSTATKRRSRAASWSIIAPPFILKTSVPQTDSGFCPAARIKGCRWATPSLRQGKLRFGGSARPRWRDARSLGACGRKSPMS